VRAIPRSVRRDDSGLTLTEMLVAMVIFSIVVAVAMAGTVIMTRSTVRADVVADSGDSLRTVFQRFDKQVRYAEAINFPGTGTSGARYVEFRVSEKVSATHQPICTQWRWVPTTGQLQMRSWVDAVTPTVPAWKTVANHVLNVASAAANQYPFSVTQADATHPKQILGVWLSVGKPDMPATADTATEFVARNSSTNSLSNTDANHDGKSDTPVCIAGPGRP